MGGRKRTQSMVLRDRIVITTAEDVVRILFREPTFSIHETLDDDDPLVFARDVAYWLVAKHSESKLSPIAAMLHRNLEAVKESFLRIDDMMQGEDYEGMQRDIHRCDLLMKTLLDIYCNKDVNKSWGEVRVGDPIAVEFNGKVEVRWVTNILPSTYGDEFLNFTLRPTSYQKQGTTFSATKTSCLYQGLKGYADTNEFSIHTVTFRASIPTAVKEALFHRQKAHNALMFLTTGLEDFHHLFES